MPVIADQAALQVSLVARDISDIGYATLAFFSAPSEPGPADGMVSIVVKSTPAGLPNHADRNSTPFRGGPSSPSTPTILSESRRSATKARFARKSSLDNTPFMNGAGKDRDALAAAMSEALFLVRTN